MRLPNLPIWLRWLLPIMLMVALVFSCFGCADQSGMRSNRQVSRDARTALATDSSHIELAVLNALSNQKPRAVGARLDSKTGRITVTLQGKPGSASRSQLVRLRELAENASQGLPVDFTLSPDPLPEN